MRPETLIEARAWDTRRDAYAAAGHSDREAARRAWELPAEQPDASKNTNILKMLKQDGDAKIAKDLDCYPCGACRRPACFVCEYAKARRRAKGFIAKNYLTNSHRQIPETTMARIRKLAEPPKQTKQVRCQNCRRTFEAQRMSAKWCGPTCRKAGTRAA